MRKKKQQNDVGETEPEVDIKSLIHQHSQFFDKLIELIPAKFYFSKDEEKPWYQGLSKAKKAAAKKESRENIKKARRDRLDPDKASITTLDLLKQNLEKEKAEEESDDDDDEVEEEEDEGEEEVEINPVISGNNARSATYEELRERYQRKLQELRGARHADPDDKSNRELRRIKRQEERGKRKRGHDSGVGKKGIAATKIDTAKQVDKVAEEASKELRFSHVKIGDEDDHRMKKKRKLSKQKELEKAKELQEAKADPERGAKESWRAATSKAAGVKVHDDPKLLKQSIKKEKKRQQKNAEKWKERVESQSKVKAGKQEKRSHNIAERIQEKKARKIAKREKKLMRPGFEGPKKGYINETTTST